MLAIVEIFFEIIFEIFGEVIICGFGRFGQIIGRIMTASHIPFTALDKDATHVGFVRRFGNKIFYGDASRMDTLEAAGIAEAKLLVLALDDPKTITKIAHQVRVHWPHVKIIARARNRGHAYQLYAEGLRHIIRETFESSLQAAAITLQELGFTEGQALEKVDMFRIHDEQLLAEAGYKDPKTMPKVEILYNTNESHKKIAMVKCNQG